MDKQVHGYTKAGLPVHVKTSEHLPSESAYQRFNKRIAIWITRNAGSMSFFWICWLICLTILPSCLHLMGLLKSEWVIPAMMTTFGFNLLMTWFASTCLELVLMPAIMVGQNLQSEAADVRAMKTFEDTEELRASMVTALDRLDTHTEGGLKEILDRISLIEAQLAALKK